MKDVSENYLCVMNPQSKKGSRLQAMVVAGWIAVTAYGLLTILYLVPFYTLRYRLPVNFLRIALFYISMTVIGFVLVPLNIHRKRFYRSMACIALGFLLIVSAKHAYEWRVQLTEKLIQTYYCHEDKLVVYKGYLLIGIWNAGGVVINDHDHCTMPDLIGGCHYGDCYEELYYCDRDAERRPCW